MNLNYIEKLEYNKILENLCNFCTTDFGKNLCFNLQPSSDKSIVIERLSETLESTNLISHAKPYITNINNIDYDLKILNSNGTLSIASILKLTRDSKK